VCRCWLLCFSCLSCHSHGSGSCTGLTSLTFLALFLHSLGIAPLDHVSENYFRNLEGTFEFAYGLRGQNHIDKDIDTITMALNGVCQTASPPLIDLDDLSLVSGHDLFDTIHNGTCLFFAGFGAENECKFVISLHEATSFLWVCTWSVCRNTVSARAGGASTT